MTQLQNPDGESDAPPVAVGREDGTDLPTIERDHPEVVIRRGAWH